jgi:hypothetical protein
LDDELDESDYILDPLDVLISILGITERYDYWTGPRGPLTSYTGTPPHKVFSSRALDCLRCRQVDTNAKPANVYVQRAGTQLGPEFVSRDGAGIVFIMVAG